MLKRNGREYYTVHIHSLQLKGQYVKMFDLRFFRQQNPKIVFSFKFTEVFKF